MESVPFLSHLRRELDAFAACLRGDLTAPVEHCGAWTREELARHVGGSSVRVTAAIREQHGDGARPPGPEAADELRPWFIEVSAAMLTALDQDPSMAAWTYGPRHDGRQARNAGRPRWTHGGNIHIRTSMRASPGTPSAASDAPR